MGNTLKFLIEYSKYIKNIEKSDNTEQDDYIYNEISKRSKNDTLIITEGLIHSYPSEKSVNILTRRFPSLSIEIKEDGELLVNNDSYQKLREFIPLITNLGYFISSVFILSDRKWTKHFKEDDTPSFFILEPKYDRQVENIPDVLYHVSPLRYIDKILKKGLSPRSGNKLTIHPERIYLTDSEDVIEYFGRYLIENQDEDGYCVYSVSTKNIDKLYSDINMRNGGYYTINNIPPTDIELISEYFD